MQFNPNDIDPHWTGTPLPPCFLDAKACFGHVLGTDEVGRDVLARLGRGGEISLGLSLITVFFEIAFGAGFGILSRYGGAVLKFTILRVADALSCFPAWPFLMLIVILATPPDHATLKAIFIAAIIAILLSPQILRPIAIGNLRDVVHAVSDHAARDLTRIIVLFATIDFFGWGVQPPTPTWGAMLADWPENVMLAWWSVVFPAVCLFGAILTIEIMRRRLLRFVEPTNEAAPI
ncbi:MAG TPA: hypothetical protein VN934_06475 [Candidatus Tumulicola sp.]|nr:hypothetical protein [Candidatus Tumulicola sp.]